MNGAILSVVSQTVRGHSMLVTATYIESMMKLAINITIDGAEIDNPF